MSRALGLTLGLLATAASGADRSPVLVELFTSEGCSSCPQADEALAALATEQPVAGAEIIPLELHVDYWNQLGWTDPFSLHEATLRQERYATGTGQLYTPQMVVDGTRSFVGNRQLAQAAVSQAVVLAKREVRAALRPAPGGVDVQLHIGPGESRPVDLWLALSESGLSSKVTRGENRGRTLAHAAVVRSLEQVTPVPASGWTGTVRLPLVSGWRREALTVVAFAQDRTSGRVVGIGTVRVTAVTAAGDSPTAPSPH